MNSRYLIPAAVLATLAVPGVVLANANTVTADCAGLSFNLPRGEEGTVVTTTLDGRQVRSDRVATFGAPLVYTIVSPDQSRSHVWTVVVDSVFNADQTIVRTVPACVTPTTTSTTVPFSSATTSTIAPAVVVVTTTTGVDVGPPPTPPVVTPSTTPTPTAPMLPATGTAAWLVWLSAVAVVGVGFGSMLVWLNTWSRK